jgi:uncharacterized protein (TIGR03437 family)
MVGAKECPERFMNRATITFLAVLFLAAGLAQGQTTQTRVYTEPAGSTFYVDGTKYTSSATFFWPKGSKHSVWVDISQNTGGTTRMTFSGWQDDKALLQAGSNPYITVTADPSFLSLKASFSVEHRIDFLFGASNTNPFPILGDGTQVSCPLPGTAAGGTGVPGNFTTSGAGVLFISGTCVVNSVSMWAASSSLISLNAFPARGFVFEGWLVNGALPPDSFLRTYTVNGPAVLSPRFSPAKRVTIQTVPPGLQVMVDRTLVPTRNPTDNLPYVVPPWEFDFAEGSTHILGAPATQLDLIGKTWILDSFSTGGGEGSTYKAVGANIPDTITARFVRGTAVSILTNPLGVRVNVDGRETWPSYNFVWGVGTKHTITAPTEATDIKGRKYKFLNWVHGGGASQQLTTPEESEIGGVRWVANYELYPRVVVSSSQPGSRLTVDGAVCPLPCTLDRPSGTAATLTVPETMSLGLDTRAQFDGWSDAPSATRTVNFSGADRQISFRYRTFNRLVAIADPAEGATFRVEPASADGFYQNDITVQVTAVANEGFKFRRWDGDLAGPSAGGFLSMQVPRVVRAQMDKVPFIPSAGIRNAAGETPVKAVAPGSIVSIFGAGFASDYVAGAPGPLTQTLGNVTVRIGTRLLPLLFVSPEQVNAFIPSDLADGEYTLAVRNGAQPEIPGKVTVVRNAPGLFGQQIGDQFVATAQRPDGSLAAPDKPAKRGEQIVLMGTGFGPYQRPVLDGFPAADNPPNPLRATTEILVGDAVYAPDFAGAAPGLVGVTLVRFTVPADWTQGAVELRVRQAGVESNTALLPVE